MIQLNSGRYVAKVDDKGIFGNYKITIDIKTTAKSYIFNLVEILGKYGAPQMEDFFSKGNKKIISRDKPCGHAMQIWSEEDFTIYPFQAGIPYHFVRVPDDNDDCADYEMWSAACCGDNDTIKSYFENGGKPNRRYRRFGRLHSLIAGAYRNKQMETVQLLYDYGEKPLESEYNEIGYIPGYAVMITRYGGLIEYVRAVTESAANDIFKLFSKLPDSEMVETVRLLKDSQTKKIFEKFSENA